MRTEAIALPPFWRVVAVALLLVARFVSLAMLALLLFFDTPLDNPLRLMRGFAAFVAVPWLSSWLIRRAHTATASIENGVLSLQLRGQRIEIPCNAIARATPWALPLPAGGVSLHLQSERSYSLQVPDPIAFIAALGDCGADDEIAVAKNPSAAYARSRYVTPQRWYHPLLEFPIFALLPTLPLFRLHQWIAYGGTFGEYYTYGLRAYVVSFLIHWGTLLVYLLLYSNALRLVLEPIAFAAAWLRPGGAPSVRRLTDVSYRVLYFGGVPTLLALRFFGS